MEHKQRIGTKEYPYNEKSSKRSKVGNNPKIHAWQHTIKSSSLSLSNNCTLTKSRLAVALHSRAGPSVSPSAATRFALTLRRVDVRSLCKHTNVRTSHTNKTINHSALSEDKMRSSIENKGTDHTFGCASNCKFSLVDVRILCTQKEAQTTHSRAQINLHFQKNG